jgi:hypothetical protein
MRGPDAAQLDATRSELRATGTRRLELRPLPLEAIEVALQYAAAGEASRRLPAGQFEADAEERPAARGHWRERAYTLTLPDTEVDLLLAAFRSGQTSLSLSYAFLAQGISGPVELTELSGPAERVDALREQIETERDRAATELRVVRSDTSAIEVGSAQLDTVFREISFDEELPPGYLALRIYCYDFRDGLAPDLYRKEVEIEARSPGGRRVPVRIRFERSDPDVYVRLARFPTAVRVDRPMRYRVTQIDDDGNVEVGAWIERDTWRHELDITDYDSRPLGGAPSADPEESP